MQRRLILFTMTLCFLALSIVSIYSIPAEPLSENDVTAKLDCSFDSGSHLTVRVRMIVNHINVFDTNYEQKEIENIATTNPYVMGAIMLRLHESIKQQIETAFKEAEVKTITTIPVYEKPYFIDDFQVNLTPAFFHYNDFLNLSDLITGVLDMGATITYYFNLQAEHGWNMTYEFSLPRNMVLTYANTSDSNNNRVTWIVSNLDGISIGKNASLSVQLKKPTTIPSDSEDIFLEYTIDTQPINDISFIDTILLKKIDISRYNVLPKFITGLKSIPADGIRLFINNDLLSWENLFDNTIQPIKQQTIPFIENSSFYHKLNLSFHWDPESTINCSTPFNITHMDDTPAIRAHFKDSGLPLSICQIPARAFFGLINAGATASISPTDLNFNIEKEIIYPYNILIRLPANISLDGQNIYMWNKTKPITGVFLSEIQPTPPYEAERVETQIEIELVKIDLNLLSLLSGKTELVASTKMKEDDRLYVISRTNDLIISPKINITYFNADAFRLCVEEKVFTKDQLDLLLSQKTEAFQQRLSEVFHPLSIKGSSDNKIFYASLLWDGDISSMDDVVPVIVSNYGTETYSIGFNMSLWPAKLTIEPQQFMLQSIQNQTVVYRVILPRGITLNATENTGKPIITGKTNDGRDYVELSFEENSLGQPSILTCALNATPIYILGLFLPLLLLLFLLIILVLIFYLIRKKKGGWRRGKRKIFKPEESEPIEYTNEDYYVPPPPGKKKI